MPDFSYYLKQAATCRRIARAYQGEEAERLIRLAEGFEAKARSGDQARGDDGAGDASLHNDPAEEQAGGSAAMVERRIPSYVATTQEAINESLRALRGAPETPAPARLKPSAK